jgi:hypothetical protein
MPRWTTNRQTARTSRTNLLGCSGMPSGRSGFRSLAPPLCSGPEPALRRPPPSSAASCHVWRLVARHDHEAGVRWDVRGAACLPRCAGEICRFVASRRLTGMGRVCGHERSTGRGDLCRGCNVRFEEQPHDANLSFRTPYAPIQCSPRTTRRRPQHWGIAGHSRPDGVWSSEQSTAMRCCSL